MASMTAHPPRHAFGPSAQEQADLREYADFAATQDPVALAAATWFSRRHDRDAQAEFAAWLAADALHAHDRGTRSFDFSRRHASCAGRSTRLQTGICGVV